MKEGDIFEKEYRVTAEVYNGFMQIFSDRNPLHTDPKFAMNKGFQDVVMHGGILTGFLSNFIGEQLPVKNVIIQSYKIGFVKPVYLGAELHFRAEVTGAFESVKCVVLKFSFSNNLHVVGKGDITIGII